MILHLFIETLFRVTLKLYYCIIVVSERVVRQGQEYYNTRNDRITACNRTCLNVVVLCGCRLKIMMTNLKLGTPETNWGIVYEAEQPLQNQ